MKVVVAPDSYKGSLTAKEVADCIEKGIKKVDKTIEVIKVPMADGGEGTVQSLVNSTKGKIINLTVRDPLMREINSFYGILGNKKTAIIEMAAASGLPLLKKEERNPMKTTTYGTGQLIKDALDRGCKHIIIGLGGSATNDGGCGMVMALGGRFIDSKGECIKLGAENLDKIEKIDLSNLDNRLKECSIVAACDVKNPLVGREGASYIFGKQKGANEKMIEELDKKLRHYGRIIEKEMGIEVLSYEGAGAAGGLGAGILAFLNGKLRRGVDIIVEATNLESHIKDSDLVITGEGMIDIQTAYGKTPLGVANVAKKYNVPVIAIAGGIGEGAEELYDKGFNSIFSIVEKPMSLEQSISNANILLEKTAERIMRVVKINYT